MLKIKPYLQSPSHCGPASLKIVFGYYGLNLSEKEIARAAKTTLEKGTSPKNMVRTAKHFGFKVKYKENSTLKELKELVIKRKIPVIINWFSTDEGHYSVVVGFDKNNIYFADPEFGRIVKMSLQKFEGVWFDFNCPLNSKDDFRIRPIIIVTR